jgi:hypothetical protein
MSGTANRDRMGQHLKNAVPRNPALTAEGAKILANGTANMGVSRRPNPENKARVSTQITAQEHTPREVPINAVPAVPAVPPPEKGREARTSAEEQTAQEPDPAETREILQIIPAAPGWNAVFSRYGSRDRPAMWEIKPVMAFALVFDHDTGLKSVDRITEYHAANFGDICSNDPDFIYYIGPGEMECGRDTLEEARRVVRETEAECEEFRKDPEAWRARQEEMLREAREG